MQHVASDDDARTSQGGNCVYIRAKDSGDFRHNHIAYHTASNASQHAKQSRWNRTQMIGQCLPRACHRKQPKSGGVEDEDSMLHTAHFLVPEEGCYTRDDRNRDVPPILDRCGRNRADENIAGNSSERRRRESKHKHPEDIQLVPGACYRAADRESEGANEIEDREQQRDNYFFSNGHGGLLR